MERCLALFPFNKIELTEMDFVPGPYFVAFPKLREALTNHVPIKTQARSCTILPNFVGFVVIFVLLCKTTNSSSGRVRFLVHNGKDYVPVLVTQDMVGHKLGEFSHTKKRFVYRYVLFLRLLRGMSTDTNKGF